MHEVVGIAGGKSEAGDLGEEGKAENAGGRRSTTIFNVGFCKSFDMNSLSNPVFMSLKRELLWIVLYAWLIENGVVCSCCWLTGITYPDNLACAARNLACVTAHPPLFGTCGHITAVADEEGTKQEAGVIWVDCRDTAHSLLELLVEWIKEGICIPRIAGNDTKA